MTRIAFLGFCAGLLTSVCGTALAQTQAAPGTTAAVIQTSAQGAAIRVWPSEPKRKAPPLV